MSRIRTDSNRDRMPPIDPNHDESVTARKRSLSFRETFRRKQLGDRSDPDRTEPPDDRQSFSSSGSPRVGLSPRGSPEVSKSVPTSDRAIDRVLKALADLAQTPMRPGVEYTAAFTRLSPGVNGVEGKLILKDRMLRIELIGRNPLFMETLRARLPDLRTRYGLTEILVVDIPPSDFDRLGDDGFPDDGSEHDSL